MAVEDFAQDVVDGQSMIEALLRIQSFYLFTRFLGHFLVNIS